MSVRNCQLGSVSIVEPIRTAPPPRLKYRWKAACWSAVSPLAAPVFRKMTDRNLSSRLSLNCEPALFAPGSLTKNLNCACGVWPAALMAATPACAVASSLVLTTRTLYLRSGGGAFLLWLPADAAAGSVRARTARADPTTLVHLTLDRIRASSSPGIPGLLGWRDRCQRRPALARLPALCCSSRATEPNRPFVVLQEKSASERQIFVRGRPKPPGGPPKKERGAAGAAPLSSGRRNQAGVTESYRSPRPGTRPSSG